MHNSNSTQSSLLENFRAAGRLVNEWRDTLSYGALIAVSVADVCATGRLESAVFLMASIREGIRGWNWYSGPELQIAGDQSSKLDREKLSNAAFAGACSLLLAYDACKIVTGTAINFGSYPYVALDLLMTTKYLRQAGGLREVFKAYTDVMWDYPRKRGGGGKTQTQRLKDGFLQFADECASRLGGFVPQPIPVVAERNMKTSNEQQLVI